MNSKKTRITKKTEKRTKLKNKLNRFSGQITPGRPQEIPPKFPERYSRLARTLKGELVTGPAGAFCLVKTLFPFGYKFGSVSLQPPTTKLIPLSAVTAHQSETRLEPERLLFVDTETTGLGGSGTVPFLIGCGSISAAGFEIRQYFLPDYADETELLEGVSAEIVVRDTSVTYNGGPFDLPIIKNRMIINRVARELGFRENLDLLPATRRLYRRRLHDCTLTNIERELFGFYREDDTPGFLMPSIYFDWLSSENVDQLPGVLLHNRWDILAMYFLLDRLVQVAESEGGQLDELDDLFSLQRLYQRRRSSEQVMKLCQRLTEPGANVAPDMKLFQAMAFKRSGAWDRAVTIWQSLARAEGRVGYEANIELAKFYEHREKNPGRALEVVKNACKNVPSGRTAREAVSKRLNRLQGKLQIHSRT